MVNKGSGVFKRYYLSLILVFFIQKSYQGEQLQHFCLYICMVSDGETSESTLIIE